MWTVLIIGALASSVLTQGQEVHPRIKEVVTASITGSPDEYEADEGNCPVANCAQWYLDLGPSVYDGDYPDWIEIHNPLTVAVQLAGYGLSDDPTRPFKWVFPNTTLQSGGYLVVFASGKNKVEQFIPTNFELSRVGETIVLTAPGGILCDSVFTGEIPIDCSMGRRLDAPSEWAWFDSPTPGRLNDTEVFAGFQGSVVMSP